MENHTRITQYHLLEDKQNQNSSLSNGTIENYGIDGLTAPAIAAGCFISLIIFVILFGNIMVIFAVIKDRHLKIALQNRFIVSMAVADMLIGVLIMPLSLQLEILKYWALGAILCDIWLAMDVFLCTASTLSLVVISLDRYWSVTKALEYPQLRTSNKVNICIGGIWLTSALVSLPPLAGWKSNAPSKDDLYPSCHLSNELGYIVYSLTISFYIPMVIISVAYGRIFLVARRRSPQNIKLGTIHSPQNDLEETAVAMLNSVNEEDLTKKANNNGETHSLYSCESNTDYVPNQQKLSTTVDRLSAKQACMPKAINEQRKPSESKSEKSNLLKRMRTHRGREKRATITIAIIVMGFIICWLPFSVLYLIGRLCLCGLQENPAFTVMFWLGYCNSAVNPVLYSIFNRDFRLAFHRLLCRRHK